MYLFTVIVLEELEDTKPRLQDLLSVANRTVTIIAVGHGTSDKVTGMQPNHHPGGRAPEHRPDCQSLQGVP